MADNERAAALLAVVDALKAADLTDDTLFAVDVDARNLARLVRERVPVRRVGLAEPAERLYDAVLDESCMALVQVVKQLPAFEPRALTELLARFSHVIESIGEVLHRLPRTTLDAPSGSEHDEEFRARYLTHVSETLDELEQSGIDVRRYKPRTLVSVAYLSLQVSTHPGRRGRSDRPDERWFTDGRRTVTSGSSSLRTVAVRSSAVALPYDGDRDLLRAFPQRALATDQLAQVNGGGRDVGVPTHTRVGSRTRALSSVSMHICPSLSDHSAHGALQLDAADVLSSPTDP